MKRLTALFGAALSLAFTAALMIEATQPAKALAQQTQVSPPVSANLLRPELPEGFSPLGLDNFGVSPDYRYFVYQEGRSVRVLRQDNLRETVRLNVQGFVQVGFDPLDRRLYVLETDNDRYRFRFINPRSGAVLLDQRYQDRPEIRTDFAGVNNVLSVRDGSRTQVILFNAAGRTTYRQFHDSVIRIAVNLFTPTVAFLDSDRFGRTRIEVVNSATGRVTVRETVTGQYDAGFEPAGSAFVVAADSRGSGAFSVKMTQGSDGRSLLYRTFQGPVNAGFSPDSRLLGIRTRQGTREQFHLFNTSDGAQVSRP